MSKGKLKKHLECLRKNSERKNIDFSNQSLANVSFAEGIRAAERLLDEAKRDFPFVILADDLLSAQADIKERADWFEDSDYVEKKELIVWFRKWFGDTEWSKSAKKLHDYLKMGAIKNE